MNTTLVRYLLPPFPRRRRDTLLRVFAAVLAVAMLASGLGRTTSVHAGASCDVPDPLSGVVTPCPPPALLNPQALQGAGSGFHTAQGLNSGFYTATTAQIQSLQNLEQQAVTNAIQLHGLASSDATAMQSWGRDDAEAQLWALLVQAIQTPRASRTTDQQNAVDWLTAVDQRESVQSADDAGLEYVKWAGLGQTEYQSLLAGNPSQSTLQTFLSGPVLNYNLINSQGQPIDAGGPGSFNLSAAEQSTGGYCVYQSPAPYGSEYTGYNDQTCVTPCTNVLGCNPPTPSYDQFTKWGAADANDQLVNTAGFVQTGQDIALEAGLAGVGASAGLTGVAIGTGLSTVLAGTAFQGAVFPFAARVISQSVRAAMEAGVDAGEAAGEDAAEAAAEAAAEVAADAEAVGGAVAATGIGVIVAAVIFAVAVAVTEGISVVSAAQLPGQLATLIADAPTTTPDLSTVIASANGTQGLYSLFVGATLPSPLHSACDNSQFVLIAPTIPAPCLNTTPIPAPNITDPVFAVQAKGATNTTYTTSISWQDTTSGVSTTAWLSETWFIAQVSTGDLPATTTQTLRIRYTDWSGNEQIAWLIRNPTGGYTFVGLPASSLGSAALDPATCVSAGTCTVSPTIDYVGTDGYDYSASVRNNAFTIVPTISANPVEGSPVTFTATGIPLLGVTYQWQFEQPSGNTVVSNCNFVQGEFICSYNYTPPVSGATVSYTWATGGIYHVQLTASDAFGTLMVDTFTVAIGDVPPTLFLYPPPSGILGCTSFCNIETVPFGTATTLAGTIAHADSADTETVTIDWGDGAVDQNDFNGSIIFPGTQLSLSAASSTVINLSDTHTYAKPGSYTATVSVTDQGGGTATQTVTEVAQAAQVAQAITFASIPNHTYGDARFAITATGGGSGQPVTFTSTDPTVCIVSGATSGTDGSGNGTGGAAVTVLTPGTCTITANQAGTTNAASATTYTPAPQVSQSFTVQPAPLTITAASPTMIYNGMTPAVTPSYSGFVNGESAASLTTQPTCGSTAPSIGTAGRYPTSCVGAADPNYSISYVAGTLTIKPAPLTITAGDKTTPYGQVPAFTWTGSGWVHGESSSTLATAPYSPPTCGATVTGSAESATTPPGIYPGAIACQGAVDPNYAFTYNNGTLTIDPLLSLGEQGLPSTVPHQATLDGATVSLPDTGVEVAYGSTHSYSFPATVTDSAGTVYITNDPGFNGAVTANRGDTAIYQTTAQVVAAALASGGINNGGIAASLTQQFAAVQQDIAAHNTAQALADVQSFAAHVRAQSGKHLTAVTAQTLLTDAQLVYASLGGTGTV